MPRAVKPKPLAVGKYEATGDLLASVISRYPNSKEAPLAVSNAHSIASRLLHDHKSADALALLDRVLPQTAERSDIAALLLDRADAIAEIPARRGECADLYAAIAKKYPSDPVAPRAEYLAAYESLTKADYTTALQYAADFQVAFPKSELLPDTRYVEAESDLLLGKYSEADKIYAELLESYPNHADADFWKVRRGTSLHAQKKFQETVALLKPLVGTLTNADAKAEAHYLIGSGLLSDEHPAIDEAAHEFEASLAAQPHWRQSDEVLLELAHCYFRLNDRSRA